MNKAMTMDKEEVEFPERIKSLSLRSITGIRRSVSFKKRSFVEKV